MVIMLAFLLFPIFSFLKSRGAEKFFSLQHRMYKKAQDIKNFFFSQYLADGIRITLAIILPAIFFSELGNLGMGITISLGALCVSISDAPGPVKHKRNGMLYCNIFVFLMAILTGLCNINILLLGLLIILSSFFFTMFSVYGNRAASIGTAALLIMILRMPDAENISKTTVDSLLILSGGIWYMLLSLLFYRLTPYRPAQRLLGECIHETAKYLRIKASLYEPGKDIDDEYRKMVAQQVVVNDKQEQVRELLFKNREILKESIRSGRLLVITFADLIDLYEQIIATWYDYNSIREKFSATGILEDVSACIKNIADELDNIGFAIQSNSSYKNSYEIIPELNRIKMKIDGISGVNKDTFVLKKILINLRNIGGRVNGLGNYFGVTLNNRRIQSSNYYSKFVSHQKIDGTVFKNNLTLKSSVFRHSLRMMISCAAGYAIAKFLPNGHHSYWLLLTIVVILKPGFSLTRQRNFERFTGTIAGGLIGLLLLAFIHNHTFLFVLIIFFMIGTYTFQRLHYIVMVIFLTPYVLLLFNLLGINSINVAGERLLDTAIGSLLSFMASYFLFPHWESHQLNDYMSRVLQANINYLYKLRDFLCEKNNSILDYKLIRKEVFLATANLFSAFNRMLSEPKNKQRNGKEIYEFVALNNVLSSNIASLATTITAQEDTDNKSIALQYVKRSIAKLQEGLSKLDRNYVPKDEEQKNTANSRIDIKENDQLIEQLNFVYKLTDKIKRATYIISG